MTMIVDTLKLSEDFKAVGFAEPQARALAEKFRLLVDERLVTREYLDFKLQELRHELEGKLADLRRDLSSRTKIFLYVKILYTFTASQPSLFATLLNKKDMLPSAIYSKCKPRNS